jgi:hypothetical protein
LRFSKTSFNPVLLHTVLIFAAGLVVGVIITLAAIVLCMAASMRSVPER